MRYFFQTKQFTIKRLGEKNSVVNTDDISDFISFLK